MRSGGAATVVILLSLILVTSALASGAQPTPTAEANTERFSPGTRLDPGQSVTYYFGAKAPSGDTTLADYPIFNSYNDGLRVAVGNGKLGAWLDVPCRRGSSQIQLHDTYLWDLVPGLISASVGCSSDPETATIKNDSALSLNVDFVGSMSESETFYRDDKVAAGSSITYYFGPNAPDGANTLSKQSIFDGLDDGAQVSMEYLPIAGNAINSTGSIDGVSCGDGSYTNQLLGASAGVNNQVVGSYTIKADCSGDPQALTVVNNAPMVLLIGFITSGIGGHPTPRQGGGRLPTHGDAAQPTRGLVAALASGMVLVALGMLILIVHHRSIRGAQ